MGHLDESQQPGVGWGWRHLQIMMMVILVTSGITMRINLSMGVVAMTKEPVHEGDVTFSWEGTKKSTVMGAFLWGYCVTQVMGGALSSWGHASRWMAGSLILTGVLNMVLPPVAIAAGENSWIAVAGLRMATGVTQGVLYPSSYTLIGRWAPPLERARAGALVLAAQPIGNIITMALSGMLASTWGWPAIFYAFGGASLVIAVVFLMVSADQPDLHPHISKAERDFINKSIRAEMSEGCMSKPPTPWRRMLTSIPLWTSLIAHLGYLWGYWVTLTCIPTYIANLMPDLDISINGTISAMPYVLMLIFSIFFGWFGDLVEKRQWVSLSTNRKLFNCVGNWVPAALLILITLLGTASPAASICILILAVAFISATFCGSLMNYVDLCPNHSGVAFGLANMIGSVLTAFAPFSEGIFVDPKDPLPGWSKVFYVTAGFNLVTNLIWILWGTAEVQPWNELVEEDSVVQSKAAVKENICKNETTSKQSISQSTNRHSSFTRCDWHRALTGTRGEALRNGGSSPGHTGTGPIASVPYSQRGPTPEPAAAFIETLSCKHLKQAGASWYKRLLFETHLALLPFIFLGTVPEDSKVVTPRLTDLIPG